MLIKKKVQLDVDVELGYNEIFNWIIFSNDPEMLRRLGKLALRTAYDIEHPQDDDFRSRA